MFGFTAVTALLLPACLQGDNAESLKFPARVSMKSGLVSILFVPPE
jgi:hypothetical protein